MRCLDSILSFYPFEPVLRLLGATGLIVMIAAPFSARAAGQNQIAQSEKIETIPKSESNTNASITPFSQTGSLKGSVMESDTEHPLMGAKVTIVGIDTNTYTDSFGNFVISNIPAGMYQLKIYLRGYNAYKQEIQIINDQVTALTVGLHSLSVDLEEIVVTGTSTASARKEIGNSISILRSEDISMKPYTNMEDVLSANVSGVTLLPSSGLAGSGQVLRIRGINSISQGNDPLIYVDGIRIQNGSYSYAYSGSQQLTSTINDINPNDIDRIEIIKGAAATTLYGTEAAGGVIQIFTKSGLGVAAKPVWDFKMMHGINNQRTLWGPEGPSQAWWDAYGSKSKGLWLDQWLKNGWYREYALSIRGQTNDIGYFLSGRWQGDEGVMPQQDAEEWSLRGNVSFSPLENMQITFTNTLNRRRIRWMPDGDYANGFALNVLRGPFDRTNDQDEIIFLYQDFIDMQTHITSGVTVAYEPHPEISTQMTIGFDLMDLESLVQRDFKFRDSGGVRANRHHQSENYSLDIRAHYMPDLNSWLSSVTSVGFEIYDRQVKTMFAQSTGFPGPFDSLLTDGNEFLATEERLRDVKTGFFLQEVLGYEGKIFLTGGLRVDGHSAFGKDYGLQMYPKATLAYVLSEDDFLPNFIDTAKIRLAYGESGKAPGFFDSVSTWTATPSAGVKPGIVPINKGNSNLGPERTREIEAGIETSLLQGRLGLDATYYYQRTFDALVPVRQDPTLGIYEDVLDNVGVIENSGVEIALNATPIKKQNIVWDLSVALSTNKSKVVDMKNAPEIFLGFEQYIREGYPMVAFFGDKITNPNAIADPVLKEDQYIGPAYPTHTWQLGTMLNFFQNFYLSARGEIQAGHYMISGTAYQNIVRNVWPACFDEQLSIESGDLDDVTALQRWRCGADTDYSAHIYPADFFRLRYLALTYRFDQDWLEGWLNDAGITLAGTNLFTITSYGGLDP